MTDYLVRRNEEYHRKLGCAGVAINFEWSGEYKNIIYEIAIKIHIYSRVSSLISMKYIIYFTDNSSFKVCYRLH